MQSLWDLDLAGSRLVALTMAAHSTPPEASNENDNQWIRDLVLGINTMFKNLDIQREELRKIQDEVFILRRSIANIQKALDRLKQLVPSEPSEPEPL